MRSSAYAGQAPDRRRPVSQPVLRAQPTAETVDALRSVLDEHLSSVIVESEAERHVQEAPAQEAESMDLQTAMLLEQLQAAQERAAYAEQQAIYAGQQAEQQLAMQATSAPQAAIAHDQPHVSAGASQFAAWGGWCVAVLAVALAAGGYFTSYRPLCDQLATQTKLIELQARRSSETEAALLRSFDREREALNEQLSAVRAAAASAAAASSAAAADAPIAQLPAADSGERTATAKASKLETRSAKHEAWLAKKAALAAKREAHAAKHKAHAAASADHDERDKSPASKPTYKAKAATDDTGDESSSNDPLEGL